MNHHATPRSKSTLLVFALLMAGSGWMYFMYLKTGPLSAGAAVTSETASTDHAVSTFLAAGSGDVKGMDKLLNSTEKVVNECLVDATVWQVPLSYLKTNPFSQAGVATEADLLDAATLRRQRDQQRQSALRAVQSLQLQSVLITAKNRSCMINNGLYLEGQQIESFIVERIAPNSVVVRNGVYRFELKPQ